MDYEKKYKEAFERVKEFYALCKKCGAKDTIDFLEETFPELKKNDDESIRKGLIMAFKSLNTIKIWNGIKRTDIIAWLEKQKPVELAKDDLSTLENWIGYIQDKSSELELNDWFVEATEKVVNKMKILLVQYPNMMPKEMDEDDKNFWIEKQGEQKLPIENLPSEMKSVGESLGFTTQKECDEYNQMVSDLIMSGNKNKPKFKVGDWIVNNVSKDVFLIKSINSGYCSLEDTKGDIYSPCLPFESDFHLWTIDDAKDGDVLCSGQIIILFKQWKVNTNYTFVIAHAGIDVSGKLQITNEHWLISNQSKPATKEQRDTLFAKMKEAGYEWDADKKELKKIAQEPAWSEEDEYQINTILHGLDLKREIYKKQGNEVEERRYNAQYNWLKSLKDRILPKTEWSEEEEETFCKICQKLYNYPRINSPFDDESFIEARKEVDWLKLLKDRIQPQNNWKPTKEQMRALDVARCNDRFNKKLLKSLYNDLKKLTK